MSFDCFAKRPKGRCRFVFVQKNMFPSCPERADWLTLWVLPRSPNASLLVPCHCIGQVKFASTVEMGEAAGVTQNPPTAAFKRPGPLGWPKRQKRIEGNVGQGPSWRPKQTGVPKTAGHSDLVCPFARLFALTHMLLKLFKGCPTRY